MSCIPLSWWQLFMTLVAAYVAGGMFVLMLGLLFRARPAAEDGPCAPR